LFDSAANQLQQLRGAAGIDLSKHFIEVELLQQKGQGCFSGPEGARGFCFVSAMAGDFAPRVCLETSMGSVTVELYQKHAPRTCKNFLQLVEKGYYDGVVVGFTPHPFRPAASVSNWRSAE
jgi:peptidyl-prolyl cis-trans isomerase-like 1